MKKIININLSGRVIPIEDAAYEKLQAYIESLRRYFSNEDGRDEIINDIESRIAELMNDRVRKGAAAVTEADVEEIIATMGRPQDFDAIDADNGDANQSYQKENTESAAAGSENTSFRSRRLYRDTSDKILGGVCSGVANYLNVDPAIIRILFAIITFGGFGLGFLVYILMWLILPARELASYGGKRLFRNPDDRIIGGVAGGLGAYFGTRPFTIRLILVAPFLVSAFFSIFSSHQFILFPNLIFGSLGGTFLLAYLVLWIVLPEARSNYDKMEMRGEKVDVNRIRQHVQDGINTTKEHMKDWGEELKTSAKEFGSSAKNFASTQGKQWASEVGETARRSGSGLGHAIGVLFKAFFLFVAGSIAFALFVMLLALLFGGMAWWPVNNFLWTSNWQQFYAWGTLLFFCIVPLVGFIIWMIRRAMNVKSRSNYLGWTFGALWTIGWVCAILFASSIFSDFREAETVVETKTVVQPVNGKMIVAVTAPELEYSGGFGWVNDRREGWDFTDDSLKLSWVRFSVGKSIDSEYKVIVRRMANGHSRENAHQRAQQIQFDVNSYDSILDIPNGFGISKNEKYRGQHVDVEILVPVGKKIRFDESIRKKLEAGALRVNMRNERRGINVEWVDNWSRYHFQMEIDYTMQADGSLIDEDGNELSGRSARSARTKSARERSAKYENKANDSLGLIRQIEEEKRKKEETERRIRELEQKQQESNKSVTLNTNFRNNSMLAAIGSPGVVSLAQWN